MSSLIKWSAVRTAFEYLAREGKAGAVEIKNQVCPDHDAGYNSAAEWWTDCVRDRFELLPGVERADEIRDGWQYHQVDEGSMSSGPGADIPDGSLRPEDE